MCGPKSDRKTSADISRYRIIDKLGEGGMGVVYKAEDTLLGRTVALKLPRRSNIAREEKIRFLRGAKAAASLNHPNICTIHDLGETDGQPFVVMEYIAGETLRQRISRRPLKVHQALRLAIQIARGLEVAHREGIVHRDINSSNIMIRRDGTAEDYGFRISATGRPISSHANGNDTGNTGIYVA